MYRVGNTKLIYNYDHFTKLIFKYLKCDVLITSGWKSESKKD